MAPDKHDWTEYPPLPVGSVLAAALDQFVRVGYHGASMRDIATGAGMKASSLYNHFPSKQAMLVRLVEMMLEDLSWRIDAIVDQEGPADQRFDDLVRCLVAFHLRRQEIAFVALSELRSLQPQHRRSVQEGRRAMQNRIDELAVEATSAGRFHLNDPALPARAVVRMCNSLCQEPVAGDHAGSHRALIDAHIEIARRMMNSCP